MSHFDLHSVDTAPEASRSLLQASERAYGMIPNLHAVMAEAPAVLEAYQTLDALFNRTTLTPEERTVVWQAINVEHGCHYCVPAHTAIARQMKVADGIIEAVRNSTPLADARLEALRDTTLKLVRQRGRLSAGGVEAFLDAGFDRRQLLEVVLGVAQKTLSNYVNAIAGTPLDEPFKRFEW
jgi:uncharacterized peroxidase-related enzyme